MSDNDRRFIAYELHAQTGDMRLSVAPVDRGWMDAAHQRAPYRCLPLVIANQAGWLIPSPAAFSVYWDGGPGKEHVHLAFEGPGGASAVDQLFASIVVSADVPSPTEQGDSRITSHFGNGIVTFSIPYLFRTPRGINLWVKGPTNCIKDGIHPLEGIVETDWLPATFTMNWKLTRPNYSVRFERGEPMCMLVPIPRGLAEQLRPSYLPLESNPQLAKDYWAWDHSRTEFNAALAQGQPDVVRRAWQRDYVKGVTPSGEHAQEHQTRLNLRDFTRGEEEPASKS
jgi:hypothetical protein